MAFDASKIKMDPKPAKGAKKGAVALPAAKKTKIDPKKIKGL